MLPPELRRLRVMDIDEALAHGKSGTSIARSFDGFVVLTVVVMMTAMQMVMMLTTLWDNEVGDGDNWG